MNNNGNGRLKRVIDAVRPIGNRRRAIILFSAFGWLFFSGVVGGAGVIASQYAPQWMSTMLAMLWLGFTLAGAALISIVSARMSADEPSIFDRVRKSIRDAGVAGIAARDIAARCDIDIRDVWRIVAAMEESEGNYDRVHYPNQPERYRVKQV